MSVDNLDFQICSEIARDGVNLDISGGLRFSFGKIASELNLDEATVRKRFQRLHDVGLLRDWWFKINPNFLQMNHCHLWIDLLPPSSKQEVISKIRLMPGIISICNYYGNNLKIVICYTDEFELKKQIQLISRIANSENVLRKDIEYPRCVDNRQLTLRDLMMLKAFEHQPMKPYTAVAQELGVSTKTVKRRMKKIAQSKAISIVPRVNWSLVEGSIIVHALVLHSAVDYANTLFASISALLSDYLITGKAGKDYFFFQLHVPSLTKLDTIYSMLREQRGVSNVRIDLLLENIQLYETFSNQLDREITRASALAGMHVITAQT